MIHIWTIENWRQSLPINFILGTRTILLSKPWNSTWYLPPHPLCCTSAVIILARRYFFFCLCSLFNNSCHFFITLLLPCNGSPTLFRWSATCLLFSVLLLYTWAYIWLGTILEDVFVYAGIAFFPLKLITYPPLVFDRGATIGVLVKWRLRGVSCSCAFVTRSNWQNVTTKVIIIVDQ